MIIDLIQKLLVDRGEVPDTIKIWYIKEFLQSEVLNYIYRNTAYKELLFYGGTAMRFLLWLPRLSEDLDFVWVWFDDFSWLAIWLQTFFRTQKQIDVDYKIQKFRITLKFRNFLDNFGLQYGNSHDLYLKIEISDHFDFCQTATIKHYAVSYQDKSMVIKSLDASTLFATKLNAVLYRQRAKRNADVQKSVKWRDFYDLFRYLQHNIVPNIWCVKDITSLWELKKMLLQKVQDTDFLEVALDIRDFLDDTTMLDFIKEHGKAYVAEKVGEWK